jgi:hypothetical protein
MEEKKINIEGALKWIGDMYDQISRKFLADYTKIPSFGDHNLDIEVAIYADSLGNWVSPNIHWSFEACASLPALACHIDIFLII